MRNETIKLRGHKNSDDFEFIVMIYNKSRIKYDKGKINPLSSKIVRNLILGNDFYQICEVDGIPVGFIFVTKDRSVQLDEFTTINGKSWLFIGPSILPGYEDKNLEVKLIEWLEKQAKETQIGKLIRFVKLNDIHNHLRHLLKIHNFFAEQRYFEMKLDFSNPVTIQPRLFPEFEYSVFNKEIDYRKLWDIFKSSFKYKLIEEEDYDKFKLSYSRILETGFVIFLKKENTQEVIGAIVCSIQKEGNVLTGSIPTIGVYPSHQGKGIGTNLLIKGVNQLKEMKAELVHLSVRTNNPNAIKVYEKVGFKAIPEQTTIVFVKNLKI